MRTLVTALVVVAVLCGGWFLVSPLFLDVTVDEAFDYTRPDGSIDVDRVLSLQDSTRTAMMQEIMEAAAAAPDRPADEPMPDQEPVVVATGSFRDADLVHKGSGKATVYRLPDGRHIVRFEDFRTTNGPALVVYLAEHPAPESAPDVIDEGYLSLGKLKGNVGNQNYEVPADIDPSKYRSIVIWCELFGVLFSPAPLTPTA